MRGLSRRYKILILGIIAVVLLVIVLACVLSVRWYRSILRQDPEYVAYDYQMSILKKDYGGAYEHLSPTLENYPESAAVLADDLGRYDALPNLNLTPCVYVESVETTGNRAVVKMRLQYYNPFPCWAWFYRVFPSLKEGPHNLSFNMFDVNLRLEDEGWKVTDAEEHFVECWVDTAACK